MSGGARVVCLACGAVNRLPAERDASEAKCGSCGALLFGGKPADIGAAMFERQISRGTLPVVVDVWAPWCGPCRAMAPEFEKAAHAAGPHLRFVKLNSDVEQSAASRFGIRSIPTMLLFSGGKEIGRISGALSAKQIGTWVQQQLGARAV